MNKFVSKPLKCSLPDLEHEEHRFDLLLRGLETVCPSYEGRVFFNNPDADETTERDEESGYAGSFHIFGHSCYGDPGHCDVRPPRRPYDDRPPSPALPAEVHLTVTDALIRAAVANDGVVTVTIVPVVSDVPDYVTANVENVLKLETVSLIAYS